MSARAEGELDGAGRAADGRPEGGLPLSLLAIAPLFALYEWSLVESGGSWRNASELVLGLALRPFGESADLVRRTLLALVVIGAIVHLRIAGARILRGLLRVGLEGVLAAVLLGPALIGLLYVVGDAAPRVALASSPPEALPDLVRTSMLFGAGAWEEVLFRLFAYSLFFFVVSHVLSFFAVPRVIALGAGEIAGCLGGALLFAAFHLEHLTGWLGPGGEPFDPALFVWRLLAGILLGVLYRWRGLGVAAWAHGLFNVALALGAGPSVLL